METVVQKKTICKTIRQYSKGALPEEDLRKIVEIAEDCCKVKNYVYQRYSGVSSLNKLYPGYTIQNEMTGSRLRDLLGLPSVYFYLAMFDALADIKSQWTRTKNKVLELVGKNEGFSDEEKHYLRFLIKVSNAFEAVLNQEEIHLPGEMKKPYQELAALVDVEKLHHYLRRQVRKYHVKMRTEAATGFSLSAKAYRYENHGICIASKEKRKRIFIPLTDNNQYQCQIYLKLDLEKGGVQIHVPIDVAVKKHEDYVHPVGIALGMYAMLTTDGGKVYGEELGKYQMEYADWMREQIGSYNRNRENNPGRKKYKAKKKRLTEQMHSYINHELNRFLETEKPEIVYLAKLPGTKNGNGGSERVNRKINNSVSLWQRGYIRGRLEQKCKEQSVEIAEVFGKGISNTCSRCGEIGVKREGRFVCAGCGWQADEKVNTARNVLKRGLELGLDLEKR